MIPDLTSFSSIFLNILEDHMGLVIEVKVVPNAKTQSLSLDHQGTIKCTLKSQPEKDKANEELIKFLSRSMHIPQQDIKILSGHTSKKKIIKLNVHDLTLSKFYALWNFEPQTTIK
jgi:uncharacterized protein (TIGR00251 family)